MTDTLEQRRAAVIEAAEAYVGAHPVPSSTQFHDLRDAVRALHQPTPKRPEDVPVGTKFRFYPDGDVMQVIDVFGESAWLSSRCYVGSFSPAARIIPITEE